MKQVKTLVALGSTLVCLTAASAQPRALYAASNVDPVLREIDPATMESIRQVELLVPSGMALQCCPVGQDDICLPEPTGVTGMATHPVTNELYVVMKFAVPDLGDPFPRMLATVDPATGDVSPIGCIEKVGCRDDGNDADCAQFMASIAFTADGRLFGISGNGGTQTETHNLFQIDITTGDATFLMRLPADCECNCGESLAYNFDDGLLYRLTCNTNPFLDGANSMYSIDPDTLDVNFIARPSGIPASRVAARVGGFEAMAMTQCGPDSFLVTERTGDFGGTVWNLSSCGILTRVAEFDDLFPTDFGFFMAKGLAWVPALPASESCDCGGAGVDVFTLLDYLSLWFQGHPLADRSDSEVGDDYSINCNEFGCFVNFEDDPDSVDVFDLLDFLACWFSVETCP